MPACLPSPPRRQYVHCHAPRLYRACVAPGCHRRAGAGAILDALGFAASGTSSIEATGGVPPPPKPAPAPAQPSVSDQPAPYDHDLQRLAEILGALHFLRGICGSNEGQKWRDEAETLIEAEAPSGNRHDQMVASFNRGYRGFQQSYRTCTPAADVVIRRYLDEGAKIARDITARYAN